ncbi:MAG: TolC family protein, partial [Candidatus Binatia bacterium]
MSKAGRLLVTTLFLVAAGGGAAAAANAPGADAAADPRRVSLAEAIQRAEEDSFAVLEAAAQLETARGRTLTAVGGLLPKASAETGLSNLDGRDINNAGEVLDGLDYNRYEPSVRLYYRVNPGHAYGRYSGRRHDESAAESSLADARRTAALQASIAYLDLALARVSEEVASELVRDSERLLAIASSRKETGLG